MEIKKNEVILSISIIAFMVIIGVVISEKWKQSLLEQYQIYDTATKIDDKELFEYGMKTNIGYAFIYGNLKALDPVSYSEIAGKYAYIQKVKQEYRKHYRTVTKSYTDSQGKTYTKKEKETYWTWDNIKTDSKSATKISFLDVEFDYEKIPFPSSHQIKIINTSLHERNVYYATESEFQGTLFCYLKENSINDTKFYKNQTISETIKKLETGAEVIIFWILWIFVIIAVVIGFYYFENKWLD